MKKLLAKFGFSSNEQNVLKQLLVKGPATVVELSRATGIKRPTTYLALESLISKEIVTKRAVGRRALFEAIPRELLPTLLVDQERMRLQLKEQCAAELAAELASLEPQKPSKIGGLLVESLASERGLYKEMYSNLLRGDYMGIFNPQLAVNARSKPILLHFLKETALTKPHIREIIVGGEMCEWYRSNIRNPHHHVRTLEPSSRYTTDLILSDGFIVLLDYDPASHTAVKISQANLYTSFQVIFLELWERLK